MSEQAKTTAIHFPGFPDLITVAADLASVANGATPEKLAQLIADVKKAIADAQS